MAYATNDDIQQRLGTSAYVQLTDDVGSGAADEAIVTEARLAAEAEIDSHLSRRYAVPITVASDSATADVLKRLTIDLAAFRLHLRRPPVPVDVQYQRDAALRWLERAAQGGVRLPDGVGDEIHVAVRGNNRQLTRDEMKDL
jgi:phage gp36-like protein